MARLSKNRLDMETKPVERPVMKFYSESVLTVAAAATTTLDMSTGNVFKLTQNTHVTSFLITNVPSSMLSFITIIRVKDNTPLQRNITWPLSFEWAGGSAPNLSESANGVDIITAITIDAGETWFAFNAGASMA